MGKLGVLGQTYGPGALPVPITTAKGSNNCPSLYAPNAFGVCVLVPDLTWGSGTIYTGPKILSGKNR